MLTVDNLVLVLTVLATAVMAASAAVQAVRCEFDPIGSIFLSVTTAVGGGTIRDLLIGATPVFWLQDATYLTTAVPVSLLSFFAARRLKAGGGRRLRILAYLDAIGLALFTLVGIKVALVHGIAPHFAVVLGCVTGIAGGMFRDVLSGMTPIVLRKDIYATLSLAGGALYVALSMYVNDEIGVIVAFLAIAVSRIVVVANAKDPGA
ncbi:MAG: trimeric intracellular cation channel family protein [Minwuia sp.]|uniref:trimeric intracellular cation channel family protein n=1 Tax=Minwuia sp. TaxID=2493630 RepID=UPI003A85500F